MYKNTAGQSVTLLVIDTLTNKPKTGDASNLTFYYKADNGSVTALSASPTEDSATNAKGLYTATLLQAETNGNVIIYSGKSSTADIEVVPLTVYTNPPNHTLLNIDNNGKVLLQPTQSGVTIPTVTTLTNLPPITTGWLTNDGIADNAISESKIADGAINTATFATGTTVPRVTLVDTLTTYTDNVPQSGDSYSRIGSNGSNLTDLATSSAVNDIDIDIQDILDKIGVPVSTLSDDIATRAAAVDVPTVIEIREEIDDNSQLLYTCFVAASAFLGPDGFIDEVIRGWLGLAGTAYFDDIQSFLLAVKAKTDNLPSDPADQSQVEAAITAATSGLASQSDLTAVKVKTDNLPADPADQSSVEAAITAATSGLASQSDLTSVKSKTDNLPSDPADQSLVEAAITAATSGMASQSDLTAIKAKTDNLPTDPADQSSVEAAITAATSGLASQSSLNAVKAKTDNLPSDPADQSSVEAAITAAVNSLISSGLALQSTLLTVKTKTDNLPSDPADQSSIEAAINASVTSIVQSLTDLISNLDIDEIDAKIDDLALNAITRDYLNAAILNAVASVNSTKNRVILGPAEKCVFDGKYRRPSS